MDDNATENRSSKLTLPEDRLLQEKDFLWVLLRHRWIILLTTALFLVGAFLYVVKATPIYTSTSRVYVEQIGPRIINEYEGFMTQSTNYLYTQAELIKSTPIVGDMVDNAQIRRLRTFVNVDNLVGYIKKGLNVNVGKNDDIIKVSFDSAYPEDAAQIINAIVESYILYHRTRKRSTVSEVLSILQKEKTKRDGELTKKFQQILGFTRENGVVSFDNTGGHFVFDRLSKLSSAVTEAQLATINARADFEAIKAMASEPAKVKQFAATLPAVGVHIFVNNIETQLRSDLEKAELELKNARRHCTEGHPSIQLIYTQIDHIKQQLESQAKEFSEAYSEVIELRWTTAKQREDELQVSFDKQREAAQDLGLKAAEYTVLQSELHRTEKLCDILDDRIKELNITEDVGALNISVLEVARPADSPSKPQKARVMAMALALGLMFGGGFALLREWLDYRLRSAEEISALLGIPVLGVVPAMPRKLTIVACGQQVHLKPKSIVAEACRTIRTAVFFGVPKGEAKTVLVTSPDAGDGKTTVVSNLGITMAQAGQKTLIIDADFRKPMQHKVFEIDNEKGLSSLLAGTHPADEAIQSGPVEGLDLLPCGPDVPNPAEIINSDAFAETLNDLSERYDRVIIDSPPVGVVADSQILAAICDITLLVLRAEKSTRKHSQQARDCLLSVGGHILGVVVNGVALKHGRYGYSYYGGYGYYGGG